MLKAIIFDFDGVIANSEPAHFATFQRVLAEEGIDISEEDYYKTYLAFDDRGAFTTALKQAGREGELWRIPEFISRKGKYFDSQELIVTYSDAIAFIREISCRLPLAINSGALRGEIERVLTQVGIGDCFPIIVSAEDITCCKPDPEGYLLALDRLNAHHATLSANPAECLVIEDSVGGIRSAIAAGMKCVAVTNTYSKDALKQATAIVSSLSELTIERLKQLFGD